MLLILAVISVIAVVAAFLIKPRSKFYSITGADLVWVLKKQQAMINDQNTKKNKQRYRAFLKRFVKETNVAKEVSDIKNSQPKP